MTSLLSMYLLLIIITICKMRISNSYHFLCVILIQTSLVQEHQFFVSEMRCYQINLLSMLISSLFVCSMACKITPFHGKVCKNIMPEAQNCNSMYYQTKNKAKIMLVLIKFSSQTQYIASYQDKV